MERHRILMGMSGGVDSSVSAALLLEQGHAVEGVFLKVWSDDDASDPLIDCPWEADLADAQAVARQLGITLHIRNVQREYFSRVVEQMKAGYAAGQTPNPDVLCNSEIKFGILYDWAMSEGFDAVATGHYAQVRDGELRRAADEVKDQTYFLWRVPRERFGQIMFPIGHLTKDGVRLEAQRLGLPNATKPDSQGICFLGHVNLHDWLRRELKTLPGLVLTRAGEQVGTHQGAALATIGQRHGLGIAGGGPVYYVVEKDVAANTLIVDTKPAVMGTRFTMANSNWLIDPSTLLGASDAGMIEARIRHQGERISCTLQQADPARAIHDSPFTIHLSRPAFAIAPGQSVVLYQGTTVLGGGIIQQPGRAETHSMSSHEYPPQN